MSSYAYLFKYIIIGDSSVGKSCLLLQFVDKKFRVDHDATVGVEFGAKTINLRSKNIKMQIWDTAGQESFKSITRSYYRGSICGILVYDITRKETFDNVAKWLDETKNYANENITLVLVGNKTDLAAQREVKFEDGEKFAKENNILFFEASAKTAYNVDSIFVSSGEQILKKIENGTIDPSNEASGVKIGGQMTEQFKKNENKTKNSEDKCNC